MDQALLVNEAAVRAGEQLIAALEVRGMSIESAFWLNEPEHSEWRLLLATKGAAKDPLGEYLLLSRTLREMPEIAAVLSSSDLRITKTKDKTVLLLRQGLSGPVEPLTRWRRSAVRGNMIEDALIYRLAA
jgi:hypothetical protein